ncbi:MAG: ABC transporter ATP-binding protein [Gemmatimonadales bacterium]|jgi:phospholipid/cholesterol/gamma-HCH transport system ATP-binding protein
MTGTERHDPVIELRDVRLSFGGRPVLDGIDLLVHPRETVCILGGSGAGKSTILRLVLGLIPPDEGRIFVNGRDMGEASYEEVLQTRLDMGMVFQGAALFDSLTVFDNVAFYLFEHTDLPEAEIRERVRGALEMVDLDPGDVMALLPSELSGGMRKRVGIARALIHEPHLLLYDEPTSGLDPITTRTIDDLIRKLQRELGVTSVVVTHDLDSAFRIADRLALLFEGKIVFEGDVEEMKSSEEPYVREFLA